MSIWAEIKKSINSNLNTPLNVLIENGVIGGYRLFTESGEFTVPDGVKRVLITAIGGGGGGGGAGSVYTHNVADTNGYYINRSATGGGGGSGYFVKDKARVVTPGSIIPIIINDGGAIGNGATATAQANGSAGGGGGSVIVGDLLSVEGGSGGGGATYAERTSGNDGTTGTAGAAGVGAVSGNRGESGRLKAYDSNYGDIEGGAGGVALDVFGGAYGRGGQGGDSTTTTEARVWYGGKNGDAGGKGAVLICWGQFSHDTIY
jgi:hypothetical protein